MAKQEKQDVWLTDEEISADRTDWAEVARKVTANPGSWLLAARQMPRNYTYKINSGEWPTMTIPGFTISAVARNSIGQRADIWVKAERA